jgi:hypothetical protein
MNKPNLYIFLIDVSGSMREHFEQVNDFVNQFRKRLIEEQAYIQIVLFHSEVTVNELYPIQDFNLALQESHFDGNENIGFITNQSKSIVAQAQENYEVKDVILITDNDSEKNSINLTFTKNYENLQVYSVTIGITQTFNIWKYKQWIIGVGLFLFVSITFNICSNNEFNLTIEQKEAKRLEKDCQTVITNITNNFITNNLYVNIKPEVKVYFKPNITIQNTNNLHIKFTYNPEKLKVKIENYPSGSWKAEKSQPNYVLVQLINEVMKHTDIGKYYQNTKRADLTITGETDSVRIKRIQYQGKEIAESFYLDSLPIQSITLKNGQLLKDNSELAFLRAYDIGRFLLEKVDVFRRKVPPVVYKAKTNCCIEGGKYRTTEIELIIYEVTVL